MDQISSFLVWSPKSPRPPHVLALAHEHCPNQGLVQCHLSSPDQEEEAEHRVVLLHCPGGDHEVQGPGDGVLQGELVPTQSVPRLPHHRTDLAPHLVLRVVQGQGRQPGQGGVMLGGPAQGGLGQAGVCN